MIQNNPQVVIRWGKLGYHFYGSVDPQGHQSTNIQIRNKCIKQIGVCKKLRLSTCLKFRWESSVIMILKMTELRYRLCNLLCWRTNRNHIDPVKKEENIHHHSKHYKHSKGKTTKWYAMCMPVLYEGDQVSKILTIQNNMTAFV